MVARDLRRLRRSAALGGPGLTGESRASDRVAEPRRRSSATVMQGDRLKAYRPIPPELRRAALDDGLAAYAHGNFFEAHELLEPAWMGTDDLAERALYQGLIKLAAGYVHAVRGNPIGVERNLRGAKAHLETSLSLDAQPRIGPGDRREEAPGRHRHPAGRRGPGRRGADRGNGLADRPSSGRSVDSSASLGARLTAQPVR